jgi:hypothetical protein
VAQEQSSFMPESSLEDTVSHTLPVFIQEDKTPADATKTVASSKKSFSPHSTKAVIYSAIFPGLGQIYNRKYWKLPIVYGGFMGCAYAISFNSRYYNDYSRAYLDFVDNDPTTESYLDFLPYGYQVTESNREWLSGVLKRKKDFYRRNRDLSYIVTIGLYIVCMIDVYVDAELFNFDISQDLAVKVAPAFFDRTNYNQRAFGLQCSFRF